MDGRFLVVGTGRSGSLYVARALTALGIPTTHEAVWNNRGKRPWQGQAGEVSTIAVPWASTFDGPIVHVVRDPRRVLASCYDIGQRYLPHSRHQGWRRVGIPYGVVGGPKYLDRLCYGWLRLIEESERVAGLTERVEEIDWPRFLEYIGHPREDLSPLDTVSKTTNHEPDWARKWKVPRPKPVFEWEDLPGYVQDWGHRLGYE